MAGDIGKRLVLKRLHINQQVLLVRDIDLKQKVKFKPRKNTKKGIANREVFKGRTYKDFQTLKPKEFAEMDTVVSAKGSNKCFDDIYSLTAV